MTNLTIFDLDGTLLNTIADLGIATNAALSGLGLPEHAVDEYPKMVGNGVRRLIQRALPADLADDDALVDKALALFKDYYDQHLYDYTRPYPGIPELIDQLTQAGIQVAVASNKYQSAVDRIINHFFPHTKWTAILGNSDTRPIKPDSAIVHEILDKADVSSDNTIFVGDSGVDMLTAANAGVRSIGVTWGFRPVEELQSHNPWRIVSDTSSLSHLIFDQRLNK